MGDGTTPTCGDNSCEFGHVGMGTNGGCRCIAHRMSPSEVVTLRRRARMLRARAEAAEAERDALREELAAMRGEAAPDGWSLSRNGTIARGWEQRAHREALWVTLERRRNGYGWTHYRDGEGVATGLADRLTGPDGAFAAAEAAARGGGTR